MNEKEKKNLLIVGFFMITILEILVLLIAVGSFIEGDWNTGFAMSVLLWYLEKNLKIEVKM